jgi:dihydrofolate reductase
MSDGFKIIVATATNGGIGLNGKLPWCNSTDMKYFKNITTQRLDETKINAVIMGRKTFESLNYKPLPNRVNVCITSINPVAAHHFFGVDNKQILFFNSLQTALEQLYQHKRIENIFVIGGGMLYQEALNHPDCNELLINRIQCDLKCDTFFPEIDSNQYLLSMSNRLDEIVLNERYIHRRAHSKTF